eukprot:6181037-Pleurochrysis_carterae.AAC.2
MRTSRPIARVKSTSLLTYPCMLADAFSHMYKPTGIHPKAPMNTSLPIHASIRANGKILAVSTTHPPVRGNALVHAQAHKRTDARIIHAVVRANAAPAAYAYVCASDRKGYHRTA